MNALMEGGIEEEDWDEDQEEGEDQTEEDEIIQRLEMEGRGRMFEDHSFPANNSSLYRNPSFVPEYDADEGSIKWMRPGDFSQDPDYFKDGVTAGDVIQGRLGDCWLLGSMAAVAAHAGDLIENLFNSNPEDFKKYGVYTCRFYKNGEWQEVLCDTRIPCTRLAVQDQDVNIIGAAKSKYMFNPVYGKCKDLNEQWVMLLEKAYAKLHGTYEALNGGSIAEALVDLTGGSSEKVLLTEDKIKALIEDGSLWLKVLNYMKWGYLLCCSMSDAQADMEDEDESGIIKNHAYTILDVTEAGGFHFVRVRNPWGKGEWRGDWSDRSTWWDDYPEILQELSSNPDKPWSRDTQDGTFWITFEDFCTHYNKIYVCRIFPDEQFRQYCIHGEWAGKTAGGDHKVWVDYDDDEEILEQQGKFKRAFKKTQGITVIPDSDPYWFNNPQYRITSSSASECYISLMQQDRRAASQLRENYPIAFEVCKMRKNAEHPRVWEKDPDQVVADSAASNFASRFPQREVSKGNIKLEPGFAYNVVPHASQKGKEGRFILRVFSRSTLRVERIPDTNTIYMPGSWERAGDKDTAGGPLRIFHEGSGGKDNPRWCQNPQYWLTLLPGTESSVDVKIVLRRTEGHMKFGHGHKGSKAHRNEHRSNPVDAKVKVGIVVCKVPIPYEEAKPKRKPGERGTNALGEPLPVKESSLRNPRVRKVRYETEEMKGDLFPDRKMNVNPDEWCQMSEYGSKEVATTTLRRLVKDWMPQGLLIIPTMSERGAKGSFVLEVHSDHPVHIEELPESRSKTIAGEWNSETACGSHLHPDWKKNPKFSLKLSGQSAAKVKITLSRPEKDWKNTCIRDTVGSMIGFYLMQGDRPNREGGGIYYEGKLWSESPFVPMHQVSTPDNFYLDPLPDNRSYTIMPSTFEPDKKGPFFISVVTDVEFVLKKEYHSQKRDKKKAASKKSRERSDSGGDRDMDVSNATDMSDAPVKSAR
mmetsp:Transcript_16174/g.21413  ORF Transcript_16174/g.21413 Transcript_16174/m.21413 type:complete len:978 (+) Transcript_16174:224-3157(+)